MLYHDIESELLSVASDTKRFVLGFSGGVDSRVLLHIVGRFLKKHRDFSCVAVNVHHGLSPSADSWAKKCKGWASQEGVDFALEKVKVETGLGKSIEQEARLLRYAALKKHMNEGDVLLTAQHMDDQFETFLLSLKRGSGVKGLSSMSRLIKFNHGFHHRPMLSIGQERVISYAIDNKLDWVEDESNQDLRYDRNFLRHKILPQMIERWTGIRKAILRTARLCAEQDALLNELLAEKFQGLYRADGGLVISGLTTKALGYQIIRMWLNEKELLMPSEAQLSEVWKSVVLAKEDANPVFCYSGIQIRRHKGALYIVNNLKDVTDYTLPIKEEGSYDLPMSIGRLVYKKSYDGTLRAPCSHEAVTVRFGTSGIIAKKHLGSGRKKLKKILKEYGVPNWERNRVPLVYYNDNLVAIGGFVVVDGYEGNEVVVAFEYNCPILKYNV